MQLPRTPDVSWAGFNVCVWTIVELQLGIICSCAPCLRAFYRCYFANTSFSRLSVGPKNKSPERTDDSHTTTIYDQPDSQKQPASNGKHVEIDMQALTRANSFEDVEAYDGSSNAAARPSIGVADPYQSRTSRSTSEGRCRAEPVGAWLAER
jgi:hypothetical protein